MSGIFDPLPLRGVTLRNRLGVAPMCQYSADDGVPGDWHLTHLVSRAVGGHSVVITEATAVVPEGRISPGCTGLWDDRQTEAFARITALVTEAGAVPAVQLAHAGRKASTGLPWVDEGPLAPEAGGWPVVGPSPIAFDEAFPAPVELDDAGIEGIVRAFADSAVRAAAAGFRMIEIHAAHGYLLHSFLSPISNRRTDRWGGDLAARSRFLLEVTRGIRRVWPDELPLSVRISSTDWIDGGWDVESSVELARWLREEGVDLVDCSSGGTARVRIPVEPGYQVPFAARVRREAQVATAAVGLLTDAEQAAGIIGRGEADLVLLGREALRDPYAARRFAADLGTPEAVEPPRQYRRGWL
jgi:2,4-dienoyl-CoA reductase-like NADH-dependent reductase (Old Yellow Enzyme family)